MEELKVFQNPEFGSLRTVEVNGEPWMVGKDVAFALGYVRTADSIRTHIDEEDKGVYEIKTPGGKQPVTIINESGLVPNQRFVEGGLFEIKETAVTHSDGHIVVNRTPKVTGKGQAYFINKFLGGN